MLVAGPLHGLIIMFEATASSSAGAYMFLRRRRHFLDQLVACAAAFQLARSSASADKNLSTVCSTVQSNIHMLWSIRLDPLVHFVSAIIC